MVLTPGGTWWYAPASGQTRQPTLAPGRMSWLALPPGMEGALAHGTRWLGMDVVIPAHLMVESEELLHVLQCTAVMQKTVHSLFVFFLTLSRSVHKTILKVFNIFSGTQEIARDTKLRNAGE